MNNSAEVTGTPKLEDRGLLNTYINLLENKKKQSELLSKMIYSVIWHKVEGESFEKRTLIDTIKRIDHLNNPDKLRELMDDIIKGMRVYVHDIYEERALGKGYHKFSEKFTKSLKKVLYD